ncbi:hypothetical protein M9H77_12864 [Catharanthus roseus]|uniref:Uncharacterized protein n=1 Tax=Catharanthus roseus TaxID=4058 RepID=A0ACC0BII8_CATRO|nr:hypothetical protein M9H77_12864 [Catharanthus roseus]
MREFKRRVEHGDHFIFFTIHLERHFKRNIFLSLIIHDVDPWNNCDSLGIEEQRKSGGKGVLLSPTNSSISFPAKTNILRTYGFEDESFQRRAGGMTRDAQRTVELLQGPVTYAKARRMEEEHQ